MPETETDKALLPDYYNSGGEDLIALAFSLGIGEDACAFNIAKYVLRYRKKNGLQDLLKAKIYLDRLIEHVAASHKAG